MENQALLDPKKLAENLKGKVKQEFINLIPEAEWDNFLVQTINDFKKNELEKVIKNELSVIIKEKIAAYMQDNAQGSYNWKRQRTELNEELTKSIELLAPAIFTQIIQGAVQSHLQQISNNMRY